jgi:molybdopterin synthase catalytic subunit
VDKFRVTEVVIQYTDFDVAAEYAGLRKVAPKSGAVVFFVGLVRDLYQADTQSERIDYIELQHYAGMSESQCQAVIDEARERYAFDAVRLIHRVGKLYAKEQIVFVAVAGEHREKAFAAVQFIMDYLKTRATLWKKEVGSRGEHWLGLKQSDASAEKKWSSN